MGGGLKKHYRAIFFPFINAVIVEKPIVKNVAEVAARNADQQNQIQLARCMPGKLFIVLYGPNDQFGPHSFSRFNDERITTNQKQCRIQMMIHR